MARTKGAFEYTEDAEEFVLKCVGEKPQTTNAVSKLLREQYFKHIHPKTVERLLDNLQDQGKIKKYTVGRTKVWQS